MMWTKEPLQQKKHPTSPKRETAIKIIVKYQHSRSPSNLQRLKKTVYRGTRVHHEIVLRSAFS